MAVQSYCIPIITSLSILLFPLCVDSLNCSEREYAWPPHNIQRCCLKCSPGDFLQTRCSSSDKSECEACPEGQFNPSFNTDLTCTSCSTCKPSLRQEEESPCLTNQNRVCRCQQGFTSKSQSRLQCEPEPTPQPTPTHPPTHHAATTCRWLLVVGGCLLATGSLLLLLLCALFPVCIRRASQRHMRAHQEAIESTGEEEKESLPVQEVCDKLEKQQVDV